MNLDVKIDSPVAAKVLRTAAVLAAIPFRRLVQLYTDRDRLLALTTAQTVADARLIESGQARFDPNTEELLSESVQHRQVLAACDELDQIHARTEQMRAVNKTRNLVLAVLEAARNAEQMDQDKVVDQSVSIDWFERWRTYVEGVSDDNVRAIWARVLAEETRIPQSFSYRFMHSLSLLGAKDASEITFAFSSRVNDFVISEYYVPNGEGIHYDYGSLVEIGILANEKAFRFTTYNRGEYVYIPISFCDGTVQTRKRLSEQRTVSDAKQEFATETVNTSMRGHPLSKVGKEMTKLVNVKRDFHASNTIIKMVKSFGFTPV